MYEILDSIFFITGALVTHHNVDAGHGDAKVDNNDKCIHV